MPAPSPVVPVWTVTGMPSADAVSYSGYTARSSGRNPARSDAASGRADPSSRTARSSSVTAASPLSGSTDAKPMNASGWSRAHARDEVVGDRRQTGVGLGVPREQHAEDVGGAEHVGHLVHVVARERRAEVAPRTRDRSRPARRRRTPASTGGRGRRSPAARRRRSVAAVSATSSALAGSTCAAGSRGCAPRRACRARTRRTAPTPGAPSTAAATSGSESARSRS